MHFKMFSWNIKALSCLQFHRFRCHCIKNKNALYFGLVFDPPVNYKAHRHKGLSCWEGFHILTEETFWPTWTLHVTASAYVSPVPNPELFCCPEPALYFFLSLHFLIVPTTLSPIFLYWVNPVHPSRLWGPRVFPLALAQASLSLRFRWTCLGLPATSTCLLFRHLQIILS